MIAIPVKSTTEIAQAIARRAKAKRLSLNLSQKTLANRAAVSYASLKKFEQTGKISLQSLLNIALVLGVTKEFEKLFDDSFETLPSTLDELLANNSRKRGRK